MRKGTTALVAFPLSHTPTSNVRYIAFSMSFNENKLRTFTLPEMLNPIFSRGWRSDKYLAVASMPAAVRGIGLPLGWQHLRDALLAVAEAHLDAKLLM